jgi:dihydrolipoamide dehydrogenase
MEVTLVDLEKNPGGVCLYRGCVPSKTLLNVTGFLHEVEQAARWGISVGEPEIDSSKVQKWKDSVVKKLTGGLGQLCKQRNINYVRGRARLKDSKSAIVEPVEGEEKEIAFDNAILATGSKPQFIPGVPDSKRVMTSRQALDVGDLPETLLVVGAGYIGLELGQVYASLGTKVTVVEMLPEILSGADRDLVKFLSKRLNRMFEGIHTETKVENMEEEGDGIHASFSSDKVKGTVFDKVMLAVGRKPLTDNLGLENTGISLTHKGFIEVDGQRRTAEANIYAVGDVAGEPMLAHKATHEGRVAVEAIAGKSATFAPRAIPFVVFSDPEIAWCGLNEREAEESGREVKITSFPWAASGRAVTLARTDGMTKVISDSETGAILGVGIAGHNAAELLAEGVLAMEMGAVADDIALTIHTHPTLSETMMEASEAYSGHSTHYKGK